MSKTLCLCALVCGALPTNGWAAEGRALYERYCAPCHGTKGDGNGEAAYLLSPKPRDFSLGLYKFRSTESGSLPTDADLLRTLKNGVPGTAMPAWDRLSDPDLAALVEHIKTFSERFKEEEPDEPFKIGTPPAPTPASIAAGGKIYERMKCTECHGAAGHGDGPAAKTLLDDQNRSIRPYDFTRGAASMKGGASSKDLYRTFTTGLSGTPMPGYADLLKDEERWQLVHFVESLSTASSTSVPQTGTPKLRAVETQEDLPLDPNSAAWKNVPATLVPLRPLWARDDRVETVEVRAAVGPDSLAVRFEWRDAQKNQDLSRHQDFRDAVAIQFAPNGKPGEYVGLPFIGMGDTEGKVTVWHWKADWAADIAAKHTRDVGETYAAMHVNEPTKKDNVTTDPIFLAGLAAKNPMSAQFRKTPIEVLVAKGFGTLTSVPQGGELVEGSSVWQNGVWSVVMRRKLDADIVPSLEKGRVHTVAVAVWNGEAGDRDGQKAVSQWMELVMEGEPSSCAAVGGAGSAYCVVLGFAVAALLRRRRRLRI